MTTVAQVIQSKPDKTIYTITPAASVRDAIKLMAQQRIGALLVTENDRIVGMVTERDYARKVVLMGRSSSETPVRDIMTSPVMYVTEEQSNEECMALMTENRLRHLPVMRDDQLVGLVSIGDLVKDIISQQQFVIEQLENYIRGDRA